MESGCRCKGCWPSASSDVQIKERHLRMERQEKCARGVTTAAMEVAAVAVGVWASGLGEKGPEDDVRRNCGANAGGKRMSVDLRQARITPGRLSGPNSASANLRGDVCLKCVD